MSPEWIWLVFVFAFGACAGSFLNVVIYRLPRDRSLITPPSSCPSCSKPIRFYDNIPLVSWIFLRGKCRNCKVRISPRYFIIEFLTAAIFLAVFILYFTAGVRRFEIDGFFGIAAFARGGWIFYLAHILLLAAFLAASAIDLELWIIPLSVCWFATAFGVIASTAGGYIIDPTVIHHYRLFPIASAQSGALAVGAVLGLIISLIGLATGIIKRSYGFDESEDLEQIDNEPEYSHRLEVLKEVVFLLPIIICAITAFCVYKYGGSVQGWWVDILQNHAVAGFLGSVWGYFIGCAIVWLTRILGTLGFGKEAMGLGDVHLMGAAGALIGPVFVVIAFFVAPFFGLLWAFYLMFFKKTRQIPYGPFLSLAVFLVMILHDWFRQFISDLYFYR